MVYNQILGVLDKPKITTTLDLYKLKKKPAHIFDVVTHFGFNLLKKK